mgnify:CR=1 FL=1
MPESEATTGPVDTGPDTDPGTQAVEVGIDDPTAHPSGDLVDEPLILTDQGLITQEQCDNTLEAIRRTGKKQGELLVEMGILSEGNLRYGLDEQLRIKLFEICQSRCIGRGNALFLKLCKSGLCLEKIAFSMGFCLSPPRTFSVRVCDSRRLGGREYDERRVPRPVRLRNNILWLSRVVTY